MLWFLTNNKTVFLLLFICGFLLYGISLRNQYTPDDYIVVENNKQVQGGIKALPKIFTSYYNEKDGSRYGYRPLGEASFAIELNRPIPIADGFTGTSSRSTRRSIRASPTAGAWAGGLRRTAIR